MASDNPDKIPMFPLQDVEGDIARAAAHQPHDHEHEVAHAWEHFRDNLFWFTCCFFPVILLSLVGFLVNFGNTPHVISLPWHDYHVTGNMIAALVTGAARCALIVVFLEHLFKDFSFVFRTLAFTLFFLGGMIYLSLWDSEVKPGKVGDPIYDHAHPESMHE